MSEADEQREIVRWFRNSYPEYALSLRVSQSGGFRGAGRRGAIRSANMAAMGAVTGESDLAILVPRLGYGSLLIEHKASGGTHKATEAQLEYLKHHNETGNCAILTRGVEAAKAAITQYMGGGYAGDAAG